MASKVVEVSGQAIENFSAEKVVFAEKKSPDLVPASEKVDTSISPKDFYWDQILYYLVSAILGLSFLDISVEFFRGSTVHCYTPEYVTSRDHIAYFNNYCYGSLPNSQYYLIFILVSALFIIAPHYLWTSYFGAHFDFFFDLAKKLHRLRDTNTGEYSPNNFELVKKLEEKFSASKRIFLCYKLKLLAQFIICWTILITNAVLFKDKDYKESFCCPKDTSQLNTTAWPLEEQIECIYNSLTLLYFLRNTVFVLVSVAIMAIIIGLIWCHARHTAELGAKEIATFCHESCLPPEEHFFPLPSNIICDVFCCKEKNKNLMAKIKQFLSPQIKNDLEFLVARLFYADTGHGEVFKHIYIQKELKKIISEDHELLYLLTRIHSDLLDEEIDELIARSNETPHITYANKVKKKWNKLKDLKGYFFQSNFENPNLEDFVYSFFEPYIGLQLRGQPFSLKEALLNFLKFVPRNNLAFDISFGNKSGHSLILSRAFHEVATVHFNKFYQNSERVFKAEVYEAYRTLTFQADIFSQSAQNIFKSEEFFTKLFVEQKDRRYIDLIVIGPISDESKVITANLLIEKLYAPHKCFRKGSILMAIRPLMIGTESRTNHFIQYQPSKGIFKELKDDVNATLANNCTVYSVKPNGELEKFKSPEAVAVSLSESDEDASPDKKPGGMARLYGIPVYSNNVFCIYEFRVFKYIGRHGNE